MDLPKVNISGTTPYTLQKNCWSSKSVLVFKQFNGRHVLEQNRKLPEKSKTLRCALNLFALHPRYKFHLDFESSRIYKDRITQEELESKANYAYGLYLNHNKQASVSTVTTQVRTQKIRGSYNIT